MGPSTLASWVLLIARALRERDIDADSLLQRAGMSPARLHDANARYPLESMQRLWRLSAEAARDPCFGLAVGSLWHPTTFHALGYAALASASLREALSYVARYCRIVSTGANLDLVDGAGEVELTLSVVPEWSKGVQPAMRIPVQAGLAAVAILCRQARGGSVTLQRVTFADADCGCLARLQRFFDCPVLFKSRNNALVFRAHELDAPLPTVNPELQRINQRLADGYLAELDSTTLAVRVRAQLARLLPAGQVSQAAVASALRVSLRTLQRKLKQEGVTFRRLLDQTRAELAGQYLEDGSVSRAEAAYLLGFSEVSSLSRALRRWRRQRPTEPD
jgi:AraC-like DNA-binding protein